MTARVPLVVFPYFQSNPFVTITLLAASTSGYEIMPEKGLDRLAGRLDAIDGPAVLHVHWTHTVCQQEPTAEAAYDAFERFCSTVDRFRERGGRVIWTIHNTQPHELAWPEIERQLSRYLASVADRIHVMNPATAELMRPSAVLPVERIVEIPHPSYAGIYTRTRTRAEKRAELGFAEDERVVALVGELRRYKGVATLVRALEAIVESGDDPPALLLAGKVPEDELDPLRAALPTGVHTVFHPRFIPSAELADWYGAADLCVLPYERILNSGSAHMAATAGTPVALPDVVSVVQVLGDEPWVHLYDHTDPVGGLTTLLADPAVYERHPERAEEFSRERSPWRISQRMVDELYSPVLEGR